MPRQRRCGRRLHALRFRHRGVGARKTRTFRDEMCYTTRRNMAGLRTVVGAVTMTSALIWGLWAPQRALAISMGGPLSQRPALATDSGSSLRPLDQLEQVDSTRFVRNVQWAIRKLGRHIMWSISKWAGWAVEASVFVIVVLLAPLCDRELLQTWRQRGFGAFCASSVLTLAVYVRLLIDSRSPILGKLLLLLSVLYGMKGSDLLPDDWWTPLGWLDDVAALGIASWCFMWLCPDRLVEEHALKAAQARERSSGRHLSSGNPRS